MFTFGYGEGYAYLGDAPQTCANCHVMQEPYDSWLMSSHHAVAVCNDCHTPHDNMLAKYITKADNGFFHSLAFTTGDLKDPIQIKQRNSRIVQAACHAHSVAPRRYPGLPQSIGNAQADPGWNPRGERIGFSSESPAVASANSA